MTPLRRLVVAAALAGLTATASAYPFDALYIFGDSLSDAGNNALVIGTDGAQPIDNSYVPSQPYGPPQGIGQYNVWAYSFASAIGLGAYAAPSLAGGGNYAFGGARTSKNGDVGGFPPSLRTQAKGYLDSTGGTASASALYVVAGGGNCFDSSVVTVNEPLPPSNGRSSGWSFECAQESALIPGTFTVVTPNSVRAVCCRF